MRLIYHPEAEAEVIEAARFYERRVPGLGGRFLDEFDAAVSEIDRAPDLWPMVRSGLHRHTMRRFPYAIYYRIEGDALRILVVKHHSRHPDYGKDRLGGP